MPLTFIHLGPDGQPMQTPDPVMQAIEVALSQIDTLPPEKRGKFVQQLMILLVSIMRGTAGDEFARGFLDAALRSLDEPDEFVINIGQLRDSNMVN